MKMETVELKDGKRYFDRESEAADGLLDDLINGKFKDYFSINEDNGKVFYIPGSLKVQLTKDGPGFIKCTLTWIDFETGRLLINLCDIVINDEDSFTLVSEDSTLVWPFILRSK
jgi:hypothetical protein